MEYVIYLSDNGYWEGKTYVYEGLKYPVCDNRITEKTTRYKSEKLAENMAQKLFERCPLVNGWEVELVDEG